MPFVTWTALAPDGSIRRGNQFVAQGTALHDLLAAQGLELLHAHTSPAWLLRLRVGGAWNRAIAHVVTLLQAQISLEHALEVIIQTTHQRYVAALAYEILQRLRTGADVVALCTDQSSVIGPLYGVITHIGMRHGCLATLLQDYTSVRNGLARVKRRSLARLVLPLGALGLLIVVATGVVWWMVPLMVQLYGTMGTPVPFMVYSVQSLRDVLGTHGRFILGGIAVLGATIGIGWWIPPIAYFLDRLLFRLPGLGRLRSDYVRSQWAMTVGTCIEHHIPLVAATQLSLLFIMSPVARASLQAVIDDIYKGRSLAAALAAQPLWNEPEFLMVVQVGSASERLAPMLRVWGASRLAHIEDDIARLAVMFSIMVYVLISLGIVSLVVMIYQPIFTMPGGMG